MRRSRTPQTLFCWRHRSPLAISNFGIVGSTASLAQTRQIASLQSTINRSAVWVSVLFVTAAFSLAVSSAHAKEGLEPSSGSRVPGLIQQLGSRQYAIRKSAEDELRRLGRAAFDELLLAQFDENPEIRFNVQRLLSQLPIRWVADSSSEIVQELTGRYGKASQRDKVVYAYWLVRLEDGVGLKSLARIVRFETSELIAKQAAVALIDELDAEDPIRRQAFIDSYAQIAANSRRGPVQWLTRLAADLGQPQAQETCQQAGLTWQSLTKAELELESSNRTDEYLASILCQRWAESAFQAGAEESAREAVEQLIDFRRESPGLVAQTALWLIEKSQYELFEECIWQQFEELRESLPLLAYTDYMVKIRRGQAEEAERAADQAFELTEDDEKFPDAFERAYTRFQLARRLELEDYPDVAIREYRRLIEMPSSYQVTGVQVDAVRSLSELLHDRQREKEAAETLSRIAKPGKDALLDESEVESSDLARMYYFFSEHHRLRDERAEQIANLNKAIEANPTDADVLIAMFRLPRADESWKKRTSKLIAQAVQSFESRLKPLQASGEFESRSEVATYLNQVAWLVGNTEGDFQKAIKQSRRSLELRPGSGGSLDTLGRAYFAAGYMDDALRYQRRAVRLLPSSKQIVRQLDDFEAKIVHRSAPE